jgi:biotin synthase
VISKMTRAPFFLPTPDDLKAVGQDQVILHEQARSARDQIFNGQVFIRAVVEISNYCRENCHYCGMRRDNRQLDRFRLNLPGLMESLLESLPDSVTDLDIQAGEDPKGVRDCSAAHCVSKTGTPSARHYGVFGVSGFFLI